MTAEWVWNDPDIPPEDLFLRRIPRKPDFVVPNLVTKQLEVKTGALRFDDADGMSVNCVRILDDEGQDKSELCNWETHTNVEFPAEAARATGKGGVVLAPVDGHPLGDAVGKAHSLVRADTPSPDRNTKRDIQAAIAARCRWVDEDPHKHKQDPG